MNPTPTNQNPSEIEVDTGGLHSKPEIDNDHLSGVPPEPNPEVIPVEPDKEEPGPQIDPGHKLN